MSDLVEVLGKEHPLSQMILNLSHAYVNSLMYDSQQLARNAGFAVEARPPCVNTAFRYTGKAVELVFQSDLPKDHKHYWEAIVSIGNEAEGKVDIDDVDQISIFVRGKDDRGISMGRLTLLGMPLNVIDGKASCKFGEFRTRVGTSTTVSFDGGTYYGKSKGHLATGN